MLPVLAAIPFGALACTTGVSPTGAVAPGSGATIDGTPRQIVAAAAAIFRQHRIPFSREGVEEGTVEGGRFEVGPFWDGDPVENRVDP